jgi:hypothetical protein
VSFKMPEIFVGETVLWWPEGQPTPEDRPSPAMVTGVSERTISLTAYEKDAYTGNPQDGVRHVGDPELKKQDVRLSGAWEYGPQRKMFARSTGQK